MDRTRNTLVVGLFATSSLWLLMSVPAAADTSGTMTINTDTTLTEDHNGDIIIDADNVTLDCAGWTITPDETASFGVLVRARTKVTVMGCNVTGFTQGIVVEQGSSSIYLTHNTTNGNGEGFRIDSVSGVVIEDNTANGNASWGFILSNGTTDSTMSRNTANNNDAIGFALDIASNNELLANRATGNPNNYTIVSRSLGNTFSSNSAVGGGNGFTIADDSNHNILLENTATGAWGPGFIVSGSSNDNAFARNLSTSNGGAGFVVWLGSSRNLFTDNSSHRNQDYGFMVGDDAGTDNVFTGDLCIGNDFGGSVPTGLCNESGSFGDDDGSIFEFDIEWMNRAGITKGCNPPVNDLFCLDAHVTRGQMAAFLVRALSLSDDGGGNSFVDDDGSVFEADVAKLAAAGITRGCNPPVNDRFCPDDSVTRGQMAAFLVRALGYTDDGSGDLFVDDDGSIFEDQIDKFATAGVTRGCNPPVNDQFCPTSNVTRGQMAAFLHRALG